MARATTRPRSAEAFDLILRSLAISHFASANKQAVPMLERAVALDPNYAPAWQELAQRYYVSGHDGGGTPDLDRAEAANQHALALNPNASEVARMLIVSRTERGDLEEAYDAAQDFLRKRPDDALAHASMGYVLRYAGLIDESIREYETALELDPTNYVLRSGVTAIVQSGDYTRALEFLKVDAGSEWSYGAEASILLREGKYEEARDVLKHAGKSREAQTLMACLNHRPRAEIQAEAARAEVRALAIRDPEDTYGEGVDFSFCGLEDRALKMLRLGVEGNYLAHPAMDRDPLLANVRGTPEFTAIRALAIQRQNQFIAHRAERDRKSKSP